MKGIAREKKILCIIPARGGSKGVKRKNIRDLAGKPLIAWTIEEARKSNYIDRVVVSTEDAEIAEVSKRCHAEVIERPDELAQDTTPSMDVVFHVLNVLMDQNYYPDYVMLLQCTSPFRKAFHIDEAVSLLLGKEETADSLVSVTVTEHPPYWLRTVDGNGFMQDFINHNRDQHQRRQESGEIYRLNGSIYLCKTNALKEAKDFETSRTIPYVMEGRYSTDIDTEEDFSLCEFRMRGISDE